ncbi:hypothetical protein FMUND_13759 [Fusarium mundagurra]|uniref:Uncharacterized protein n=2 Tax=Fusarium TaxID=5506 RepID=A0A8H5XY80_9HYPO|nr:hypothetical protein FBEOM_12761 [Fusarium beomiforme]KAF5701791.1 hypothetical protein FMUND_13759 [Fusarium mundagurra]
MDHKIFQYGLIQGTRGFSSLNNDNVAYVTRNGTVGSVRNDDARFIAVLQSQLHRFDIEKQHIQHVSTKSGFEVYIQFSGWRRFVELSWEGDSCRATAELPKGLKNVNVQLRKCTTVVPLGTASPEPLTYPLDDRDIYTILFDPAMYEGFVVVFSADGEHQTDMRAISKPLAYRGPLCKINEAHTLQSASSSGLRNISRIACTERQQRSTEQPPYQCTWRTDGRYYKDVCASFTTVQYRRDGTTHRGVLARESDIAI